MKFKFTRKQIDALWEMATSDSSLRDPNEFRKDFAGAWIKRDQFGSLSPFGWTACRIKPIILGGTDSLENLMPCHWRNKMMKGTNYPEFESIVSSMGRINITLVKSWEPS